ncbi:MAG: hypothetical protein KME27_27585 [Lyngbya sp. HA4199-MV5]|nr:hypothetical protein [Lyngbya sp. HA4199-MV5]
MEGRHEVRDGMGEGRRQRAGGRRWEEAEGAGEAEEAQSKLKTQNFHADRKVESPTLTVARSHQP